MLLHYLDYLPVLFCNSFNFSSVLFNIGDRDCTRYCRQNCKKCFVQQHMVSHIKPLNHIYFFISPSYCQFLIAQETATLSDFSISKSLPIDKFLVNGGKSYQSLFTGTMFQLNPIPFLLLQYSGSSYTFCMICQFSFIFTCLLTLCHKQFSSRFYFCAKFINENIKYPLLDQSLRNSATNLPLV